MYGYKILLFTSLVLPIFAVPLQGSTILQKNAVVERNDDPVGATILPSLPKRESVVGLVQRKNRSNGYSFDNSKRRSDSLETRGGMRGGGGGGKRIGRCSDNLETREEIDISVELSNELDDRGITKVSGNGRRGLERHASVESKRGLSRPKIEGSKRQLQRPDRGGGGKRGLPSSRGGSK